MTNKYIDLTGQKIGRLTVIKKGGGRYTKGGQYKATWLCRCECGNEKEYASEKLRKGHTHSCGCLKKEIVATVNVDDITGQKFGRLTVIRLLKQEEREDWRRQWLCRCDCGNEIQVNSSKLRSGHTRSCGCLCNEKIGNLNKKYKYVSKKLYGVYKMMLDRCYNPKSREYHNYGERGIGVCEDWKANYDTFAEWAFSCGYDENAKQGECTLDRADVNGNYSPNNCRWVSMMVQCNNKRDNIYAEYNGERHTVAEWSRILGINYQKLTKHIKSGKTIGQLIC